MKRSIPVILICIILFNIVGYVFLFMFFKSEHQREMLLSLNEHNTEAIEFPIAVYNELDIDDHEFDYQGKRYDIFKIEKGEKIVKIFCKHDSKEEKMREELEKKHENDSEQSSNNKTFKVFKVEYFPKADSTLRLILIEIIKRPIEKFGKPLSRSQNTTPPPQPVV